MSILTFWQMAVVVAVSTCVPLGSGHKLGSSQVEAWSVIAPPDDWSAGDTDRFLAALGE